MTAIARRSWSDLKTEIIRRSGGVNYSSYGTRAEQAIYAAYLDITSLYAHYPLMQYEYFSQGTSLNYHDLPSELWSVLGVSEANATADAPGTALRRLSLSGYLGPDTKAFTATGKPDGYFIRASWSSPTQSRHLVFNVSQLDTARNYYLFYQRLPTAPDFSSTTTYPQIDAVWDEHLIELSLAKLGMLNGDQQLAAGNAALFKDFVSQIGIELLRDVPTSATPELKTINTQSSGKNP